jgi:hypothetical protein
VRLLSLLLLLPGAALGSPYLRSAEIGARLHALAAAAPADRAVRVVELGRSLRGKPIVALVVGRGEARVLYLGLHHAREWLSADLVLRLAAHFAQSKETFAAREAWFVPVVNPDGYDQSFERGFRAWRKNTRDNDGDGKLTAQDGVDLNRNYDYRWGDAPRASPDPASMEYRGRAPFSEPETRAIRDLMQRRRFAFAVAYHSFGSYLVYPAARGLVPREPPDEPIFPALAGDSRRPAIRSRLRRTRHGDEPFRVVHANPDIGGRFDSWAYHRAGVLAFYVELHDGYEFEFPEDESARTAVLEDNLPFATDLLESAAHPAAPTSHLGRGTTAMVHDPPERYRGTRPTLEVTARQSLPGLSLFYVARGAMGWVPMTLVEPGVHYGRYAAELPPVRGEVQYFFAAGAERLPRSGVFRLQDDGPAGERLLLSTAPERWLPHLQAAGLPADAWRHSRVPDARAVLSAYDVVIWDAAPGEHRRQAETMRALGEYLQGGGRVAIFGTDAIVRPKRRPASPDLQPAPEAPRPRYRRQIQVGYIPGDPTSPAYVARTVRALAGVELGSRMRRAGAEVDAGSRHLRILAGVAPLRLEGAERAPLVSAGDEPLFPCAGACWLSGDSDETLARVSRRVNLRGVSRATLVVHARWDLEADNDYFFVEARAAGKGATSLAELGGRSGRGFGVASAKERTWRAEWMRSRAPELGAYLIPDASGNGWTPRGSEGEWHAITGRGAGLLRFDLTPYAGKEVDLSFVYLSDPHRHGRGVSIEVVSVPELALTLRADAPGWRAPIGRGGRWRRESDPSWRAMLAARHGRLTVSTLRPFDLAPEDRAPYLRYLLQIPRTID